MASPSNPLFGAARREVAAVAMDLLNLQLVEQVTHAAAVPPPLVAAETPFVEGEDADQQQAGGAVDVSRQEAVFFRLERLGYRVGQRLAERATQERPRFKDNLDIIKFVCKEFWTEVFRKQIDNLRTNNRGVFVLHDNKFRWLLNISPENGAVPLKAHSYVVFPCGLIRGALSNLGVHCIVHADIPQLPTCIFTIKITKS